MDRIEKVLELVSGFSVAELDAFRHHLDRLKTSKETAAAKSAKPQRKMQKVRCPKCDSPAVKGHGKYRDRRRYKCLSCSQTFNELSGTPLAGVHSSLKLRQFASQMAKGGVSLRKSAEELGVSLPTAFSWRHKIIQGYSVAKSRKLKGVAEADETFFRYSEKGSKTVSKRRKPRKRGGKAKTAGISDDQVPVIVGCDRDGEMILGVAGRGRISLKNIEDVLGDRIDDGATLCTDAHSSFRAFAKANRIKYRPINASKGRRVVKKIYHIQHANNAHARLKSWINRFRGVSTKHLDSYAQWFGLLEETKSLANGRDEFAARTVARRRKVKPQFS